MGEEGRIGTIKRSLLRRRSNKHEIGIPKRGHGEKNHVVWKRLCSSVVRSRTAVLCVLLMWHNERKVLHLLLKFPFNLYYMSMPYLLPTTVHLNAYPKWAVLAWCGLKYLMHDSLNCIRILKTSYNFIYACGTTSMWRLTHNYKWIQLLWLKWLPVVDICLILYVHYIHDKDRCLRWKLLPVCDTLYSLT